MDKYYYTFNENKYLHINNFFNQKNKFLFRKIINDIERHKLSRIARCLNNRTVDISSRYQILLYIQRYEVLNNFNKSLTNEPFFLIAIGATIVTCCSIYSRNKTLVIFSGDS